MNLDKAGYPKRLAYLMLSLVLYSIGIMIVVNANIGAAPWDVFHLGLTKNTGIPFGMVSILVGILLFFFVKWMGESIGLGSILNMLVIGILLDIIGYFDLLPHPTSFPIQVLYSLLGLVIISLATAFYIATGFGAGPRDSAMVGLHRLTGKSIGLCRGAVEVTATLLGYLLGGPVGVGTLLCAFATGPIMEVIFRLLRFDPKDIVHETITETMANLSKVRI